ncbi:MAG TPA: C39 family peptidase [Candidatus Saccharimonadales bacterium]|nr:C39 family peptidase [Candidatus Saccharimonadales bacterium]
MKPRKLPQRFLHKNIPYFSQWESPTLVENILTNKIQASDDPRWEESGAKTKEEYALWSSIGCGMACTKILIAHLKCKIIPLVELGKECVEYDGYTLPLEQSQGLIYTPYTKFLHKAFGIKAKAIFNLLVSEIMYALSQGCFVIASVSPDIRNTNSNPIAKGGHLVLIVGYDLEQQELYFHNPSGFTKETQEYAIISLVDFAKFFGNRGIVISSK